MKSLEKKPRAISRREMLKMSAMAAAAATLAACVQAPAPGATSSTGTSEESKSAPASETTTVVLMHVRRELSEEQEAQFEADHPGIEIELVEADQTRFFAMYAAGTPPDLYRLQAPSVPSLLARGLLYDLTPYFESSELIQIDDLADFNRYYFAENAMEIGTGKIYGMCKDASPDFTIWANRALWEDAGLDAPDDTKVMTYDEVMGIAEKTTKFEGDRLLQYGFGYQENWIDRMWMNMLAETGQSLYSESFDKMVLTDNEDAQAIAKWFYDMAEKKITTGPESPSPSGWFGADFTAAILAMAQYGFWYSPMAESDENRGDVLMLPGPTWSGERRDPTMTATGMIMTSATKVPDAAWEVFEWYNAGQPSIDRAKSGWGVPALKSQWDLIPQETDFQKQAYTVLKGELDLESAPLHFNPFVPEDMVYSAWSKNLDLALKGDITFDELLANIESEVNTVIADNIDRMMG